MITDADRVADQLVGIAEDVRAAEPDQIGLLKDIATDALKLADAWRIIANERSLEERMAMTLDGLHQYELALAPYLQQRRYRKGVRLANDFLHDLYIHLAKNGLTS